MKKIIALLMVVAFMGLLMPTEIKAQTIGLPIPGERVLLSDAFMPVSLVGLKYDSSEPLKFHFIVDSGDSALTGEGLKQEGLKLSRYFLAALAVPEHEMWVNLSPYEKDRIIPKSFGSTEMGRDMLAQDYLLKQISASLTFPEGTLGKKFWDRVYENVGKRYGHADIPVDAFNKVWIMPGKAKVVERHGGVFVTEATLKVMLDQDRLAMKEQGTKPNKKMSDDAMREIILPVLEEEVNKGEHFAPLRQAYGAMILAAWYKIRLKESLLGKAYVNQEKTLGINLNDKTAAKKIYDQYLQAFKKGVYRMIKEEGSGAERAPRKYFSGGVTMMLLQKQVAESLNDSSAAMTIPNTHGNIADLTVQMTNVDQAMGVFNPVDPVEESEHSIPPKVVRLSPIRKILKRMSGSKLDLISILEKNHIDLELEMAKAIKETIEVCLGIPLQDNPYLEVIVIPIDNEGSFYGRYEVTLKNRLGAHVLNPSVTGIYQPLKRRIEGIKIGKKKTSPLLDGFKIIKEPSDQELIKADGIMALDGYWAISFNLVWSSPDRAMSPSDTLKELISDEFVEYTNANTERGEKISFSGFYSFMLGRLDALKDSDIKVQINNLVRPIVFIQKANNIAHGNKMSPDIAEELLMDGLRESKSSPELINIVKIEANKIRTTNGMIDLVLLLTNVINYFESGLGRTFYENALEEFLDDLVSKASEAVIGHYMIIPSPIMSRDINRLYFEYVLEMFDATKFIEINGFLQYIKEKTGKTLNQLLDADWEHQKLEIIKEIKKIENLKDLVIPESNDALPTMPLPRFLEWLRNLITEDIFLRMTIESMARRMATQQEGNVDLNALSKSLRETVTSNNAKNIFDKICKEMINTYFPGYQHKENQSMVSPNDLGGIDLDANKANLQIDGDQTAPMPTQGFIPSKPIEGLMPVVIDITPVRNLNDLLN